MKETLFIVQPTRNDSQLGRFKLIDPHDWTDVKEIISVNEAIFDALVTRGTDLKIMPGLASNWKVSPDGMSWTFFLRKGIFFHNGESFNSQTAKFSLERLINPPTRNTFDETTIFTQYLTGMHISTPDSHTLHLSLESPNADLLDVLVDGYMVPPQAIKKMGESFKFNPVGTGAFKFLNWIPDDRVVAEANESYFRGVPKIKRVVWKLMPDVNARLDALKDGEVDIITGIDPKVANHFDGEPGIHLLRMRDTTSYTFFLNCMRGPFKDIKVRQAINFAVDKTAIINSIFDGSGYALSSFIGPLHFGFDDQVEPYPYNPEKATLLLKKAGYSDGLSVTIDTPQSLPTEALHLSEMIAKQIRRVGIHSKINITKNREIFAHKVRKKEIGDMCCFDSTPLSTYRILQEKISSKFMGAWWQGYSNNKIENLITEARRTINDKEREELYRHCFRIIHEDPPWLFLYNTQNIIAVTNNLKKLNPRLDGCIIPQWVTKA